MTSEHPYKFKPTQDMTGYDLCKIMVAGGWLNADKETYEKMPNEVKRFYELLEKEQKLL